MSDVRVTYLRDKNNEAFGCLAVKLDVKNNRIYYSYSICHSKLDTYDKVHGYHKAMARLNNDPLVVEYIRFENLGAHGITRHVMYDILSRREIATGGVFSSVIVEGLPTRLRRYAKGWLRNYNRQLPITVKPVAKAVSTKIIPTYNKDNDDWKRALDRRAVS